MLYHIVGDAGAFHEGEYWHVVGQFSTGTYIVGPLDRAQFPHSDTVDVQAGYMDAIANTGSDGESGAAGGAVPPHTHTFGGTTDPA